MKKLVLIALKKLTKEYYLKNLTDFFDKYIEIEGYSVEEGITDIYSADLIAFTGIWMTEPVKVHLITDAEIIYMNRTFTKDSLSKIIELPNGITSMFVCNDIFSAVSSISILNTIGIKHVNFVPVYPNMEEIPSLKYAITPAQTNYVPAKVEHIIDIGWRAIDTPTMLDIATKLGIMNKELYNKILIRQNKLMPINLGLQYMLENSNIVLEMTNEGIIYTDDNLTIKDYNDSILKIINISEYIGKNIIGTIIPKNLDYIFGGNTEIQKYSFEHILFNKTFEVSKKTLIISGKSYGYIFLIEDETEVKSLELRLKDQSILKGYIAKYYFDDIIGESEILKNCKEKAKKISCSDNAVLLIGESGTGKELFAQSIHNASKRNKMPFLAINCSALYPQLLESELFGYEEGAFSGAKKGGKRGLFELADKGTLFLDEISELPMNVQAKFLRILQEKELKRVGGSDIISVDVRIIAATNVDLKKLVEEKTFRQDLYYRLNIFPLIIPLLKERKEDILDLANHFMKELGAENKRLNVELVNFLINYSWPGNIRELKNCLEYMVFMGDQVLNISDLPPSITVDVNNDKKYIKKIFKDLLHDENKLALFVLEFISNRPAGRRVVYNEAIKEGLVTSEYKVRKVMEYLNNNGYIIYYKGKKSEILSEKGKEILTTGRFLG